MSKTVVVLNQSRRLHQFGSIRILPTEAKRVPAELVETKAFRFCMEKGELAITDEERKPIVEKEKAIEENDRRKKEGMVVNNGAPVKNKSRSRATGEGNGDA